MCSVCCSSPEGVASRGGRWRRGWRGRRRGRRRLWGRGWRRGNPRFRGRGSCAGRHGDLFLGLLLELEDCGEEENNGNSEYYRRLLQYYCYSCYCYYCCCYCRCFQYTASTFPSRVKTPARHTISVQHPTQSPSERGFCVYCPFLMLSGWSRSVVLALTACDPFKTNRCHVACREKFCQPPCSRWVNGSVLESVKK